VDDCCIVVIDDTADAAVDTDAAAVVEDGDCDM